MDELGLKHNETELVLTLEDKKNYLVHYRNLQFYPNQGMKLKKVQRVLQFDQECWMEPYNRMNTEFQKQAKNNFEENFYNLMNNSVLGKQWKMCRSKFTTQLSAEMKAKRFANS